MVDYDTERSRWELNVGTGFIICGIHQKRRNQIIDNKRMPQVGSEHSAWI